MNEIKGEGNFTILPSIKCYIVRGKKYYVVTEKGKFSLFF